MKYCSRREIILGTHLDLLFFVVCNVNTAHSTQDIVERKQQLFICLIDTRLSKKKNTTFTAR